MSKGLNELRIISRAAAIFFWLGVVELLMGFVAGDRTSLILHMTALPLVSFLAWAAAATYASYLTWRYTHHDALRKLPVFAFLHLASEVGRGVFLPWGGWLGGGMTGEPQGLLTGLVWVTTALAMVVLGFLAYLDAKIDARKERASDKAGLASSPGVAAAKASGEVKPPPPRTATPSAPREDVR